MRPTELHVASESGDSRCFRDVRDGDSAKQLIADHVLLGTSHKGHTGEIEVRDRPELFLDRVCSAVRHDGDVCFLAECGEDVGELGPKRDVAFLVVIVIAFADDVHHSLEAIARDAEALEHLPSDVAAPKIRIERSRADGDAVNNPVVRFGRFENLSLVMFIQAAYGLRSAASDLGERVDHGGDESLAFFLDEGACAVEVEDDEAIEGVAHGVARGAGFVPKRHEKRSIFFGQGQTKNHDRDDRGFCVLALNWEWHERL